MRIQQKGFIKICEVRITAKGKVFECSYTKNKEIRVVGITPWLEKILRDEFEYQQFMKNTMIKYLIRRLQREQLC